MFLEDKWALYVPSWLWAYLEGFANPSFQICSNPTRDIKSTFLFVRQTELYFFSAPKFLKWPLHIDASPTHNPQSQIAELSAARKWPIHQRVAYETLFFQCTIQKHEVAFTFFVLGMLTPFNSAPRQRWALLPGISFNVMHPHDKFFSQREWVYL